MEGHLISWVIVCTTQLPCMWLQHQRMCNTTSYPQVNPAGFGIPDTSKWPGTAKGTELHKEFQDNRIFPFTAVHFSYQSVGTWFIVLQSYSMRHWPFGKDVRRKWFLKRGCDKTDGKHVISQITSVYGRIALNTRQRESNTSYSLKSCNQDMCKHMCAVLK